MSKSIKYTFFIVSGTVFIILAFFGGAYRARHVSLQKALGQANEAQRAAKQVPIVLVPQMATSTAIKNTQPNMPPNTSTSSFSGAFNLAVPFVPQAPGKIWDVYHEDYCEEAALLTVQLFYNKKTLSNDEMEAALNAERDWEMKTFGYFESTPVSEVVRIAREFLKFKKVTVIENPTYDQIRAQVAAGHPVILPTNGKLLSNPHFKNGGPGYHMIIVRGFTADGDFITNDPGTQFGENYVYKKNVLMTAIHDFDHSAQEKLPAFGTPRALVLE